MKNRGMSTVIRDLQTLFDAGVTGILTDGQLLDRFVARREEAVFEAIIHRHGPMVWNVCRRVLRDHHDAEDAFQATFLVLARKAASVKPRDKIGCWLYGVANRTALKARAARARRRERESQVPSKPDPEAIREDPREELRFQLDRELSHLPEKYRVPIILCELEGKTHQEAASQLGVPIGTLSGRLSRARSMLAKRLTRQGVSLSAGSLAVLLAQDRASAGMPAWLIDSTAKVACLFATGPATAVGVISAKIVTLATEVLKAMLLSKLKVIMVVVLGAGLLAGGIRTANLIDRTQAADEPAGKSDGNRKEDTESIQGNWKVIAASNDGKVLPEEAIESLRLVINPERLTLMNGVKKEFEATYELDPNVSPRRIDLTDLKSSQSLKGIYRLSGEELRIVYDEGGTADQYPTAFVSEAGRSPNDRLLTLRRINPGVETRPSGTASNVEQAPKAMSDLKRIQGVWTLVNLEQVNHQPTEEERESLRAGNYTITIQGNKLIHDDPDKSFAFFELHPSQTPKVMIIEMAEGPDKGRHVPAIYRLDGDDLMICQGRLGDTEPPVGFSVEDRRPGTYPILLVLRRRSSPPDADREAKEADRKQDEATTNAPTVLPGQAQSTFGGGPDEPHYVRRGNLFFVISPVGDKFSIYNAATKKASTIQLPASKESPLKITPLLNQGLVSLMLEGSKISRLYLFSINDWKWYPQDLKEPASGTVFPIVGGTVAFYSQGRSFYAFSTRMKRWSLLELPEETPAQPPLTVTSDSIVVEYNGHVHEFRSETGEWQHTDLRALIDAAIESAQEGAR